MNYGVWMNIDGTITGGFESQSGENLILSQKKYNDGKWHYVIVSCSSTVLRMYIDGQQVGIIQINEKPDITGNQPLRIGANSLDLDKFFKGEIDEVRIWNIGKTTNEITENKSRFISMYTPGLIRLFNFDVDPNFGYDTGQRVMDFSKYVGSEYDYEGLLGTADLGESTLATLITIESSDPTRLTTGLFSVPTTYNSLTFSGHDGGWDKVRITNSAPFQFGTGDFTMEAWVKLNAIQSISKSTVLSTRYNATSGLGFWFGISDFGTKLAMELTGIWVYSNAFATINDNNCHHVAVTRSGSTITFYLDGVSKGTASTTANLSGGQLIIGDEPWETSFPFIGNMHDVRIWNNARSSTNIASNLLTEFNSSTPNLIGYYQFKEAWGDVVLDGSASGNNGKLGMYTGSDMHDPIRNGNKCYTADRKATIFDPADKSENCSNQIIIYPNPFKENLTILLNENEEKIFTVRLMDSSGKIVLETTANSNEIIELENNLPGGLYLIQLIGSDINNTYKLSKF